MQIRRFTDCRMSRSSNGRVVKWCGLGIVGIQGYIEAVLKQDVLLNLAVRLERSDHLPFTKNKNVYQ